MYSAIFKNLRRTFRGRVLTEEPLSRHTTWRVGGPADLFLVPADRKDLQSVLGSLKESGIPWFPLGAGSNLLVLDGGFRGAVIHLGGLREIRFEGDGDVTVDAGLPLMTLIRETVRRGLGGLEGLAGIPGTVGGGIVMNAGAGGQDFSGVTVSVALAGADGEESWEAERLCFGYRRSALTGEEIVAGARLRFRPEDAGKLEEILQLRLAHRRQAHAVRGPNAGSVFKNPPAAPAWRLIDEAGLRGHRTGGAQVSENHCNFILNAGGAKASDILELIERVRTVVHRRTGILLEPEVRIVGEN